MKTLPIFRISKNPHYRFDGLSLDELAKKLFNIKKYSIEERNGRYLIKSDEYMIDIDGVNGFIWASNQKLLWNHKIKPNLPDKEKVDEIAEDFFKKNYIFPDSENNTKDSFF